MPLERYLHIVWAPNVGPLVGYWSSELAIAHARTMVGVDLATCKYAGSHTPSGYVFVAWTAEDGPVRARDTAPAARAGEDVLITRCEIRAGLPDFVLEDISQEIYSDDDGVTPVDGVVVAIGDIEDHEEE